MIRLPPASAQLSASERYALSILVDLSRLVPVEDDVANAVQLSVVDGGGDHGGVLPGDVASFHHADGVVEITRHMLRWVTDIAGAAVEQRSTARDRHARVPSSANPLVAAAAERQPVVSLAAAALRDAVIAASNRRPIRLVQPWPRGRRWAAAFTHDLDVVAWWPLFTLLRIAELSRKGRFGAALHAAGSALATVGRSPVLAGVHQILGVERELGITSTWFVLCGTPTLTSMRAGDLTYHPDSPAARRIMDDVLAAGHEIGLHGSFATLQSERAFRTQRDRLQQISGRVVVGVRQHYLRMRPGATQRAMCASNFHYDATYGFPDRNGFRIGVADVVPCWDEGRGEAVALQEVPLIWMDRALSKYRGVEDPHAWVRDALDTAEASRTSEGLWVGLWHPNLTSSLGFPGAPAAYRALAEAIVAQEPYIDSLAKITQWRMARRGARVRRIMGGNRIEASTSIATEHPVLLEDERGRAMEMVSGPTERPPDSRRDAMG